jgi:hypothetical protein
MPPAVLLTAVAMKGGEHSKCTIFLKTCLHRERSCIAPIATLNKYFKLKPGQTKKEFLSDTMH